MFEKPRFNSDNIGPAGSIISSARDMAQWLRFQLNDGTVGGTRLVSSAALRETHTPQIVMGAGAAADGAALPTRCPRPCSARTAWDGWWRTITASSCGSTAATLTG